MRRTMKVNGHHGPIDTPRVAADTATQLRRMQGVAHAWQVHNAMEATRREIAAMRQAAKGRER